MSPSFIREQSLFDDEPLARARHSTAQQLEYEARYKLVSRGELPRNFIITGCRPTHAASDPRHRQAWHQPHRGTRAQIGRIFGKIDDRVFGQIDLTSFRIPSLKVTLSAVSRTALLFVIAPFWSDNE